MFSAPWNTFRPPPQPKAAKKSEGELKISLPPSPTPSEVLDSADWYWYEGRRVRRLDRRPVDEAEEDYDCGYLDLGAETPQSGTMSPSLVIAPRTKPTPTTDHRLVKEWAVAVTDNASQPKPCPSARRPSVSTKKPAKKYADRDCGICFEYAVKPCRTRCCGKMFCQEHLNDWLHGPNASGLCPQCDAPCTLEDDALALSSPVLRPPASSSKSAGPSTISSRSQGPTTSSISQSQGLHTPTSPLSTTTPVTLHTTHFAEGQGSKLATEEKEDPKLKGTLSRRSSVTPKTSQSQTVLKATSLSNDSPRYDASPPPSYSDLAEEDRKVLAEELGLPFVPKSINGTSTPSAWSTVSGAATPSLWSRSSTRKPVNGSSTPSLWTPKVFQRGDSNGRKVEVVGERLKKRGMYDAVFGSQTETATTASHLATLVAFLLLLYVVLG